MSDALLSFLHSEHDSDGAPWVAGLNNRQHAQLYRRATFLFQWRRLRSEGFENGRREQDVTRGYISALRAAGIRVSRSSLFNWDRAYCLDGLRGLADYRGGGPFAAEDHLPFLAEVERLYRGPGLLTTSLCHMLACQTAAEQGWTVPTFRRVQEFLRTSVKPDVLREPGTD